MEDYGKAKQDAIEAIKATQITAASYQDILGYMLSRGYTKEEVSLVTSNLIGHEARLLGSPARWVLQEGYR